MERAMKNNTRADHLTHRGAFEKNRKRIFMTQSICAICGRPVDFRLKYPDPMAATCDHIIPINKGGHPSDIDNLQLTHASCNRAKSDNLVGDKESFKEKREKHLVLGNRNLPQTMDWSNYKEK